MSAAISTGTEKEERHYREVLKGGAIGGTMGLAIGLGGVWAASARYPAFRSLTLPFRTFLVTSSATFGAIVNADRYSHMFAHAQNPMAGYKDIAARMHAERLAQMSFKDRAMAWGQQNRYSIVFASWLASMGVALALVGRAPMSTSQKLVQARVYAQGLTLAVLIATAAFEMNDAKKGSGRWETVMELDPNDPEHKHVIERKVHKEEYAGQDLWRDMVAAEEKRISERKAAEAAKAEKQAKAAESKAPESKAKPQADKA